MNNDLGNKAADLRRIANWLGRGQKEKLNLIQSLLSSAKKNPKVVRVLEHFQADADPAKVINDRRKRLFLAEQLLISSNRIMSYLNE